jgi:hypothetical protein
MFLLRKRPDFEPRLGPARRLSSSSLMCSPADLTDLKGRTIRERVSHRFR